MKVTVKDIAKKAGTSTATVSMVLNNKPSRISKATRERILRIAKEMQYVPNKIAVSLATNRSYTIGLLVPDVCNMFFDLCANGVERYAYDHGYSVFQCNIDDSVEKGLKYLDNLATRCVDGIIIIPPSDINFNKNDTRMIKFFNETNIPLVLLDRAIINANVSYDFVSSDNKQGAFIATNYLIENGHTKIGCVVGPKEQYNTRERLEGYKNALLYNDIPFDETLIYYGDYRFESGFEATKVLLEKGVSAIFSFNDLMAYGVYKYAFSHGISIPDELSVVGFDNIIYGDILPVGLTSIEQPAELMGQKACEILLNKINGDQPEDTPPINYFFVPKLVERNSVKKMVPGTVNK